MSDPANNLNLAKASLEFMLIAVGVIILSVLIAGLIVLINDGFTYWAAIPLLAGFPITILINISLAKKTISQIKTDTTEGETSDAQAE